MENLIKEKVLKNQIVELTISSLTSKGEGIASIDGFKIFIDQALIDETVLAKVILVKKNYAIGKLLKVVTPSRNRVKPKCPHFKHCGGCQIMSLDYEQQLIVKKKRVEDAFKKIGKIEDADIKSCTPSENPFNYRNKVQLPVGFLGELTIGLYQRNSQRIIPVSECHIQTELGNLILREVKLLIDKYKISAFDSKRKEGDLRHILIKTTKNQNALLIFITGKCKNSKFIEIAKEITLKIPEIKGVLQNINTRKDNVILGSNYHTLFGETEIEETLLGLKFLISPTAFFQVNTYQAEKLYKMALDISNTNSNSLIVDAYCGIGTLSCFFAKKARKVIGIEIEKDAILHAKKNAQLNKINNIEFIQGKSEEKINNYRDIDLLCINPPRKGVHASMLSTVRKILPKTILYISCNPETLARDIAILLSFGYKMDIIQPFDMFPQTMHVETLVKLTK